MAVYFFPKAEAFSSKENFLASGKATQLQQCCATSAWKSTSIHFAGLFSDNEPRYCYCALWVFPALFSPAVGGVNLNVTFNILHSVWWGFFICHISALCDYSDLFLFCPSESNVMWCWFEELAERPVIHLSQGGHWN